MPETIDAPTLLASRVIQIADIMNRRVAGLLAGMGSLKAVDIRILIALSQRDAMTIADLSRQTRIDRAWISRSSARLLDMGALAASTGADARAKCLALTPAGHEIVAAALPLFREEWASAARGLDAALAADLMKVMLHNLTQRDA